MCTLLPLFHKYYIHSLGHPPASPRGQVQRQGGIVPSGNSGNVATQPFCVGVRLTAFASRSTPPPEFARQQPKPLPPCRV